MELDSEKSFGSIHSLDGEAFTAKILEISQHSIPHEKTQKWARSLRFLSPAEEVPDVRRTGDDGEACFCGHWRPFVPADVQRESLFLTDAADATCRVHYVAVSYCWKSQKGVQGEKDRRFRIRTRDGDCGGSAPREIVERAINYAAHISARFIWIDQECIRQDNREDKELGIQSMDLVYRQSYFPLALMDTVFDDVGHLIALKQAIERFNTQMRQLPQLPVSEEEVLTVTRAMRLLGQDRWLTRAWILQEAILSGPQMKFLCRCLVDHPDEMFLGPPGEAIFHIEHLKRLKHSVGVYSQLSSTFPRNEEDPNKLLREFLAASNGFTTRITMGERRWSVQSHALTALAAFNLLEGYINSRIADRLAILANLCDYKIRLDTNVLTSMGYGFSSCFLALTLTNGDISLLQFWSELNLNTLHYNLKRYRTQGTIKRSGDLLNFPLSWGAFSWLPAPGTCLSPDNEYNLHNRGVERRAAGDGDTETVVDLDPGLKLRAFHGPVVRVTGVRLTGDGLQLDGWLWAVAHSIDLSFLRDTWRESLKAHEESHDPGQRQDPGSPTDDISYWPYCVEIIKTVLMFTVGHDVGELLWKKAAQIGIIQDEYGIPANADTRLTDFIDADTTRYVGHEKWPGCTEASFLQLLDHYIRAEGSPWRWIVPLVVKTGTLQVWRVRYPGSGAVSWESCGIFDCYNSSAPDLPQGKLQVDLADVRAGAGAVLLPRVVHLEDPTKPAYADNDFQARPCAWATAGTDNGQGEQSVGNINNDVPILRGRGMVRGIWDAHQASHSAYVLS